ncbi:MAG: guanylate kinase [Balneolales bacterium]|nr:guanylate kinase [Balneolales bacterium]
MNAPKQGEKGKVIVITAPSGAGKTTIAKRLLNEFSRLVFSVSATTRAPREGEVHGKDYYFLTEGVFQRYIDEGQFIEWEEFYNNTRYGTLRVDVENNREKGYFVLFDVEVNGALNLKNVYGSDCLTIFIKPPDIETLASRLLARGTETHQSINLRMERSKMELSKAHMFDYEIVNDDFDSAYSQVKQLVNNFFNA